MNVTILQLRINTVCRTQQTRYPQKRRAVENKEATAARESRLKKCSTSYPKGTQKKKIR
jgi:hypothetical protein